MDLARFLESVAAFAWPILIGIVLVTYLGGYRNIPAMSAWRHPPMGRRKKEDHSKSTTRTRIMKLGVSIV